MADRIPRRRSGLRNGQQWGDVPPEPPPQRQPSSAPASAAGGAVPGFALDQGLEWLLNSDAPASAATEIAPNVLDWSAQGVDTLPTNLDFSGAAAQYAADGLTSGAASAPWWQAPAGSDAAALGGGISSGLSGLGVGAETAASIGGVAGTAIPIAGAALGGYNLYKNVMDGKKDPLGGALSGAATGAAIGSIIPGVGTLIGGGVGLLAGGALGSIGTGKGKDQIRRDQARKTMKEIGLLGPDENDYTLRTRSGQELDIGIDGRGVMAGTNQRVYDIDPQRFNNKDDADTIGALDALGFALGGSDRKVGSDTTGMLFNTVKDSMDRGGDVRDLYDRSGGRNAVYGSVEQAWKDGKLDANTRDAFLAGIDRVYGISNPGDLRQDWSKINPEQAKKDAANASKIPKAPTPPVNASPTPQNPTSGTKPAYAKGGSPMITKPASPMLAAMMNKIPRAGAIKRPDGTYQLQTAQMKPGLKPAPGNAIPRLRPDQIPAFLPNQVKDPRLLMRAR